MLDIIFSLISVGLQVT